MDLMRLIAFLKNGFGLALIFVFYLMYQFPFLIKILSIVFVILLIGFIIKSIIDVLS